MKGLNLARVGLVSLATVFATGCFGNGGGAVFAGALFGGVIASNAIAHAEQERREAWEREQEEAAEARRPIVVVVYRDGVGAPALPPPAPAPPPPVPFDAEGARNQLAAVDLTGCRAAGAPRGYGHAMLTMNPSGGVSKVVVEEPAGMPPAAAHCIGAAIGRVTVPEFSGSAIRIGTTFFVP